MHRSVCATRDTLLINTLISAFLFAVISMASAEVFSDWFHGNQATPGECHVVVGGGDFDDTDKPFAFLAHSFPVVHEAETVDSICHVQAATYRGAYQVHGIRAPPFSLKQC